MRSFLNITTGFLLAALPAGLAMGQDFRGPRDNSNGSFMRRSDNASQSDQSGYGRRDSSNQDSFSSDRPRDTRSFDSSPRSSGSSNPTMAMPKSSGLFAAKPLPPELMVLTQRSIFSKDHRAVAAASDQRPQPVFKSDVAKLIFRGAMREGDHFLAYIEDSANSRPPQWVSVGELLTANGAQINDITLDNVVVEKSGAVRRIAVGQNLDSGERLPSPPAQATISAPSGPGGSSARPNSSSGAPTGSPAVTASTTGTASDEDVAEMMRRRRVEELGR